MDIFSSQKSTQPSARYPSMAELPQELQGLIKQGTSTLQSPASMNIQNILASLAGPAAGQVGATLSGAYLPTSPRSTNGRSRTPRVCAACGVGRDWA